MTPTNDKVDQSGADERLLKIADCLSLHVDVAQYSPDEPSDFKSQFDYELAACVDELRSIATLKANLYNSDKQNTIPKGWKLVPMEPTHEMLAEAGCRLSREIRANTTLEFQSDAHIAWDGMLATAPSAPANPNAMPEGWKLVDKKTCYVLHCDGEVIATLAGPDSHENAAIISRVLAAPQQPVAASEPVAYLDPDAGFVADSFIWARDKSELHPEYSIPVFIRHSLVPVAASYPECSGDSSSCPENEGHGCCKPNPVQAKALTDAAAMENLIAELTTEAFKHAIAGGHMFDLYKLPKRMEARALLASQPSAQPIEQKPANEYAWRLYGGNWKLCTRDDFLGSLWSMGIGFPYECAARKSDGTGILYRGDKPDDLLTVEQWQSMFGSAPITSAPADVAALPKAVTDWYRAEKARIDAVHAYNARLEYVQQHMPFGTSVDPEYQLMHQAEKKARNLLKPMFDALDAGPIAQSSDLAAVRDAAPKAYTDQPVQAVDGWRATQLYVQIDAIGALWRDPKTMPVWLRNSLGEIYKNLSNNLTPISTQPQAASNAEAQSRQDEYVSGLDPMKNLLREIGDC